MSLKSFVKKRVLPLSPAYKLASKKNEMLKAKSRLLEVEHRIIADQLDALDQKYLQKLDKQHLKHLIKHRLGYEPDIDNPKTFNEKIQWLKINLRRPEMITMSDKYRVRDYLNNKGYSRYLNELHGAYTSVDELKADWAKLPSQFVMKTNNDSGSIVMVKEKTTYKLQNFAFIEERLKRNYYYNLNVYYDGENYYCYRKCEWPYKDIEPCILVEEYLEDRPGSLRDYKVLCFNGKPKYIEVDIDRFTNHTQCFFDTEWNKVNLRSPVYEGQIDKPPVLDEMLYHSEKLAGDYPFIRIDWYIIDNSRLVLGELTFYPSSGAREFDPPEWDRKLGDLIDLVGIS